MSYRSIAAAALAVLLATPPASAQVETMSVSVKGLACPFCVYGVERKLGELPEVARVETDLKKGLATLSLEEGRWPSIPSVEKAVRKVGFTPGPISLVVVGPLAVEERTARIRTPEGDTFLLVGEDGEALDEKTLERLAQLAEDDATVAIGGRAHAHADRSPGLVMETLERVYTESFRVEGEGTEEELRKALLAVEGVHGVGLDLSAGKVAVESRGEPVARERLAEAIRRAGFEPKQDPEDGG